jgi:hypothetical protein
MVIENVIANRKHHTDLFIVLSSSERDDERTSVRLSSMLIQSPDADASRVAIIVVLNAHVVLWRLGCDNTYHDARKSGRWIITLSLSIHQDISMMLQVAGMS